MLGIGRCWVLEWAKVYVFEIRILFCNYLEIGRVWTVSVANTESKISASSMLYAAAQQHSINHDAEMQLLVTPSSVVSKTKLRRNAEQQRQNHIAQAAKIGSNMNSSIYNETPQTKAEPRQCPYERIKSSPNHLRQRLMLEVILCKIVNILS